jgi:hypothetical protein
MSTLNIHLPQSRQDVFLEKPVFSQEHVDGGDEMAP